MRQIKETESNQDLLLHSELQERVRKCETLVVDLDGSLLPGPPELDSCLIALNKVVNIIPCTTRSWGEMTTEKYLGKASFINSPFGIYEAGLVIKSGENLRLLCNPEDIRRLTGLEELITKNFTRIGPRSPSNRYELISDPDDLWAWSYLQSSLGKEYVKGKAVPLLIPPYPNQFSLVIWPSGSARTCPSERFFYQVCFFLDGLKAGMPQLFDNMSILVGDESVIVRPNAPDGSLITKLTGVKFLEATEVIQPEKTIFIGDDDPLDLPVTQYIRKKNGITIVPSNADKKIKKSADLIAPGIAGEAILPILREIERIKNAY